MSFACRVCGCEEYHHELDADERDVYECKGCSLKFGDPDKFTIPEINFVRLSIDAREPEKNKDKDSGHDLFAAHEYIIMPGKTEMIKTDIAIELPPVYEAQVRARSGLAKKYGIQVANSPGTIDNGYRNQIGVLLYNSSEHEFKVDIGDRIAQLVIGSAIQAKFREVESLSDTDRGLTGFGDSGHKGTIKKELA